jgi:hypothetical protein
MVTSPRKGCWVRVNVRVVPRAAAVLRLASVAAKYVVVSARLEPASAIYTKHGNLLEVRDDV